MKTEAMIYTIVAFSALLPLGVIGAFVSSERRWRRRDREQAQRLRDLRAIPMAKLVRCRARPMKSGNV